MKRYRIFDGVKGGGKRFIELAAIGLTVGLGLSHTAPVWSNVVAGFHTESSTPLSIDGTRLKTGQSVTLRFELNESQAATVNPVVRYQARGLPAGLVMDETTGVIGGIVQQRGYYGIKVSITRANGASEEHWLNWTVADLFSDEVADANGRIPGQYMVSLRDSLNMQAVTASTIDSKLSDVIRLAESLNAIVGHEYRHALVGFAATMSNSAAESLRDHPEVIVVEEAYEIRVDPLIDSRPTNTLIDIQEDPDWGLDRVDQRNLPLNNTYTYELDGTGVDAYIIDTGMLRTHEDFGGRVFAWHDAVGGQDAVDCHGHGTGVGGLVGGEKYGVAKNVQFIAIRVMDCRGAGGPQNIISGLDHMVEYYQSAGRPGVANMSLGGSRILDLFGLGRAVSNAVEAGVLVVAAAANSDEDACNTTPARVPEALTVAASDRNDQRADFSNWGSCVDIFAPGHEITSAWIESDSDTITASGTSFAAPIAAGIAALYLQENPNSTPAQTTQALIDISTPDVISDPKNSANKLVFSRVDGDGPGDDPDLPNLQAADITVSESAGSATVDLSLDNGSSTTVSLRVFTRAGTARGGMDYSGFTRSVEFPPGTTEQRVSVSLIDDAIRESTETLTLQFIDIDGAVAPRPMATITITDDDNGGGDPVPRVSISDETITEGQVGGATATVSLSQATSSDVSVKVYTRPGTARGGAVDFWGFTRVIQFPAGTTTQTVQFNVVDDSIAEPTERFSLHLTDPVGMTIDDGVGKVDVVDND